MAIKRIFWLTILFWASLGASRAQLSVLVDGADRVPLPPLALYTDSSLNLGAEELLQLPASAFRPLDSRQVLAGGATHWLRLALHNPTDTDLHYWLSADTHNPRWLQWLRVYQFDSLGRQTARAHLGYFAPRFELVGHARRDAAAVSIPARSQVQVLLWLRNQRGIDTRVTIRLEAPHSYQQRVQYRSIALMFFLGLLGAMILYNVLLFGSSRDGAYLFFALYLVALALYNVFYFGLLLDPWFSYNPQFNFSLAVLSFGSSVVFFWLFVYQLLLVGSTVPSAWRRSVWWMVGSKTVLVLGLLVGHFVWAYQPVYQSIVSALVPIEALYSFLLLRYTLVHAPRLTKPVLVGVILFGLGFGVGLVLYLKQHPYAHLAGQAGVVAILGAFAFALNLRAQLKETEKRITQEKHLSQLESNTQLQLNYKNGLQHRVDLATAELRAQQEEIEAQNDQLLSALNKLNLSVRQVNDSIRYAERIQRAVLPDMDELNELLPNSFVLFKPRDVVSGDFYWIKHIDEYLVIAAVDCTGHGVPGAFLSILGITFMNEIQSHLKGQAPRAADILEQLRIKIKEALRQNREDGKAAREAMDVGVCVLDSTRRHLQFSGAHHPLYLISRGELIEYRGDKMPVSSHRKEGEFTNQAIELRPGDRCYLFSDGIVDQFGGTDGDKFKTRRLKATLLALQEVHLQDQAFVLERQIKQWQQEFAQVDDILVIGFEV